jgi:hypothetical protein
MSIHKQKLMVQYRHVMCVVWCGVCVCVCVHACIYMCVCVRVGVWNEKCLQNLYIQVSREKTT